jgi:hypothetical protein
VVENLGAGLSRIRGARLRGALAGLRAPLLPVATALAWLGARRYRSGPIVQRLCSEWLGSTSLVTVKRERVDGEREAKQVEQLAGVADAVGAAEPHGVVEVAVDALGVVAAGEEPFEVGVVGRDGPEVLGPVQLARRVLVVAVEAHRDDLVAVAVGQLVVVVPAVPPGLVAVTVRTDARERNEVKFAGVSARRAR